MQQKTRVLARKSWKKELYADFGMHVQQHPAFNVAYFLARADSAQVIIFLARVSLRSLTKTLSAEDFRRPLTSKVLLHNDNLRRFKY